MARVYNFSAGPAVLPEEVLKEAADTIEDLSAKLAAANMERSKKNTESKCHNYFGAANNDCRFCGDDGK